MTSERGFRTGTVLPFLNRLPDTMIFPIQQLAIRGDPDYILCIRGLFVGLELKAPGGKLSKLQAYKLNKIEETGGRSFVADPDNWPDVSRELRALAGGSK
jgi:hypothetical protein